MGKSGLDQESLQNLKPPGYPAMNSGLAHHNSCCGADPCSDERADQNVTADPIQRELCREIHSGQKLELFN